MSADAVRNVLVVAFGGRVFGLSPKTGDPTWIHEADTTSQGMTVRIAVEGKRVYALTPRELLCLEYESGTLVWKVDVDGGNGTLLVGADGVFTGGDGEVRCFALDNGNELWHQRFPGMGRGAVAMGLPGATSQADRT